jgi:uncharacterized protein with PQ loop repeat
MSNNVLNGIQPHIDKIEKWITAYSWTKLIIPSLIVSLAGFWMGEIILSSDLGEELLHFSGNSKLVSDITNPLTFILPKFFNMVIHILYGMSVSFIFYGIVSLFFRELIMVEREKWLPIFNQLRHITSLPASIAINSGAIMTAATAGLCLAFAVFPQESKLVTLNEVEIIKEFYVCIFVYFLTMYLICCILKKYHKIKFVVINPKKTLDNYLYNDPNKPIFIGIFMILVSVSLDIFALYFELNDNFNLVKTAIVALSA